MSLLSVLDLSSVSGTLVSAVTAFAQVFVAIRWRVLLAVDICRFRAQIFLLSLRVRS